ncbi:phytolongin Phyl1.1-like [Impatiens glandulifera]|uniref:phytolongin Phyl1.1-like n=1 Tax=Impatiens glandulifera TaxID=253017 RepID=UPI001FB0F622|nr:phytolongin Phyl1.1-like [Impatiens glandulifera]
MGSTQNTIVYCCVVKCSQIMFAYSNGDPNIESIAALCLERIPPFHKFYFQTMNGKTFGFLMEESLVYFSISDDSLGNSVVHNFLGRLKDEFRKKSKKSLRRLNSHGLQEQLLPIIHKLIMSLGDEWPVETHSVGRTGFSLSGCKDVKAQTNDGAVSTKVPLLGKSDKRKMKEHVIAVRDAELEEIHRKSTDRNSDGSSQSVAVSSMQLQKDSVLMSRQVARNKWCKQVRIVLAVDVGICFVMLIVWLVICRGITCIR